MGPAAAVTSTQEDRISPVLSFPSGWCNTYSKSAQKRHSEPGAIGCCSNIPDLKKDILYNLMTMIGQWYNKNVNDG